MHLKIIFSLLVVFDRLASLLKVLIKNAFFFVAMELKCQFEVASWRDGERYTCIIETASIMEPRMSIKSIQGTHETAMADNDVVAVIFRNTTVEYFPLGLNEIFPNLTAIEFHKCRMKQISRTDLVGHENLIILSFPGNKLISLPDDLFVNTSKLQWIIASDNCIDVSKKLFEPLNMKEMKELDFTNNRSIHAAFKEGNGTLKDFMDEIDKTDCDPSTVDVKKSTDPFKKLMEFQAKGMFTDFTIKVREKEYKIHKAILAAQSSVFEELLSSDGQQGEKITKKIKHFTDEAFEEFMDSFYGGQVRKGVVMELFELAVEFEVPNLKETCEEMIVECLEMSNALEVYNIGHERDSDILKRGAFSELMKLFSDLDESLFDEVEIVNDFVKAKRRLEELKQSKKNVNTKR